MLYKNAELYNVEELIQNEDGSVSWLRIPQNVYNAMESEQGRNMAKAATGVELRFKMKSESVTLRMSGAEARFHVYRGAIQGSWEDHESGKQVTGAVQDFVIKRSPDLVPLQKMTEACESEWDPEVVRVIFDRGAYKLYDIIGDIEPPREADCPSKTILCYGSSITHGSNSLDISHAWPSVLAHNLNYDLLNKGMAGSCWMEPAFVDYIADMGQRDGWDMLLLELGINALDWDEGKRRERAAYTLDTVVKRNPAKPIFVISPFYHYGDTDSTDRAKLWRLVLEELVRERGYANVTYINGLDLLGDMTLLSADLIHPSIYGVSQIAARLTERLLTYRQTGKSK